MAKPLPPGKRRRIADDIRAGKTRNRTAKDHNVSGYTVTTIAREIDHRFNRSDTKDALEAAVIDHAARRAVLAEAQLALAEAATTHAADGIADTSPSQAAVIAAISIDKYTKLDRYDADSQNLSAFDRWLADITSDPTTA